MLCMSCRMRTFAEHFVTCEENYEKFNTVLNYLTSDVCNSLQQCGCKEYEFYVSFIESDLIVF